LQRTEVAPKFDGLYVIVGPDATRGRPVVEVAEEALRGGASVLQLRDKMGERGDVLPVAARLRELCHDHGALFFVNDDIALGFACDADGVHLGQTDLPVDVARRILAADKLIGRSNNSDAEVEESVAMGVDYVAVGATFPTTTVGKGARAAIGLDGIRRARELTTLPLVAIGGIKESNVADVVEAGADCVAVISAVTMADDPEAAARRLVDAIESTRS
jgi:thiamine-phosphate pyrophosphorylase